MRPMDYLGSLGALIRMQKMLGGPCRKIKESGTWPTEQTQATEQYTQCTALPKQLQVCGGEREVIKMPCGGFSCVLCDEAMMLRLRPLATVFLCTLKFLLHFLERVGGRQWGRKTAQTQMGGVQVEVVLKGRIVWPPLQSEITFTGRPV